MKMRKDIDWVAVEAEYRATKNSVNQIAKNNNLTEGTIRLRAKKCGWVRITGDLNRKLVESKMVGITDQTTNYEARILIEQSAEQDALDMMDGLAVARKSIKTLTALVEVCEDAKEVKVILEANKIAIDTIRRIRGLDVESEKKDDSWEIHLKRIKTLNG
jgi:predicted nucleic acid-binding protein